jgi:hypothetical protein
MRFCILLLAFFGASSAAVAGDELQNDMRVYDANDYAGMAYYRMDFGGAEHAQVRHAVGFRMDSERGLQSGRPALMKAEFDSAGSSAVLMNGVNLSTVARLAAAEGGGFSFANMSVTEIVVASVAGVILLVGTASALDSEDTTEAPSGTGAN